MWVLWISRRHIIVNREALWQVLRMYDVGGKLFNGIQEVEAHLCDFDGVRRGNYFGGEPIRKTKVEERVQKLQVRMRPQER